MLVRDAYTQHQIRRALAGPLADFKDPAEAWEAMATRGLLPMTWMGDPRRGFGCELCERSGCRACNHEGIAPHPTTLVTLANLVVRYETFARVEALALDALHELRRRNVPTVEPFQRVAWIRVESLASPDRGVAASGLAVRTLVNTIGIAPRWMRVFSNGEVETAVHRTGSSRPAQWTSRPRLRVAPLEAITHLGFRVAGLQYGVIRLEWGAL